MKEVVILTGAGQIGMAIARRVSMGKKLVIGDKSRANGEAITKIMNEAGFDAVFAECDLSSRESILNLIAEAQKYGEIVHLINAAGVSPSQAPIEVILKVDLYGTAVLLEFINDFETKEYISKNLDKVIRCKNITELNKTIKNYLKEWGDKNE